MGSRAVVDRSVRERRQTGERKRRTFSNSLAVSGLGLHMARKLCASAMRRERFSHRVRHRGALFFGQASRQSVETAYVLLPAVLLESGVALLLRPSLQCRALTDVLEQRHTVAAGGLHQVDIDADDLPRTQRLLIVEG